MNYNLRTVMAKELADVSRNLLGRKVPENLIWFLTERCNLTCGFCFVSHTEREYRAELSFDEIKKVFDKSQGAIKKISFTGGEPLIHKEFDKIFICASSMPKMNQLHVSTNGMCNEKLFAVLKDCKNDQIHYQVQSSIDGTESIHNEIRGHKNAYKKLVELIEAFKDFNSKSPLSMGMNLVMTVSRTNRDVVQETMELARFYGVPLTLNFVRSSSDSKLEEGEASDFIPKGDDEGLSLEEIKCIAADWSRLASQYYDYFVYRLAKMRMNNVLHYKEKGTWKFPCAAGINDAVIFSDGSVSICETKKPFGKLQDFNFDYRKFWETHFDGTLHTCYCSYDCAMEYSINKSAKGHWVFGKELLGLS